MDLLRRLHQAVKKNDRPGIQAAVSAGADLDAVWGMQGTALCQAITSGYHDNVRMLLELGCDVNGEDFDGGLPLSLAIRKRLPGVALTLMAVPSCNLNVWDPVSKQHPLCAAVLEGLVEVVEALVQDPRCDITKGNSVGNSALHVSLLHQQDATTAVLARCGGFRWLHNLAGHAPVHIAATLGHRRSLDLLFPGPTRTTETLHRDGETEAGDRVVWVSYGLKGVQRELDQRVTLTGDTALHLAVREKHEGVAERLVELGADTTAENNSGQTALLLACSHGNARLAAFLLRHGAPPDRPGHLRMPQRTLLASHARQTSLTPLHVAASNDSVELLEVLLETGADVNVCDQRGRSPLYLALLNGAGRAALHLLSRPPHTSLSAPLGGSTLLHAVCQCSSHAAEITAALLERGCSPHVPNRLGNLPLHEALCWENVEVVRVLLRGGADPCAPGEMNTSPLSFAARTGRLEMAVLLLSAGADPNSWDNHNAEGGSDPDNDSDNEEWSPLREALECGAVDLARFLVDAGFDLSKETYLLGQASPSGPAMTTDPFSVLDLEDSSDGSQEMDEDEDIPQVLKEDPELLDWLRDRARNPPSMLQLSMEAVRRVFRRGDPPFALMLALPLPHKIIARLLHTTHI